MGENHNLSEIGERNLIDIFLRELKMKYYDDGFVFKFGNAYLVVTSDGVSYNHIPRMNHYTAGWKVVTKNFSDLAAMFAKPLGFSLCVGLRRNEKAGDVKEVYKGVADALKKYDAKFFSGDTIEVRDFSLSGHAIGISRSPVYRAGAKHGDLLVVTGNIGDSAIAYKIINEDLTLKKKIKNKLVAKLFMPEARVYEACELANFNCVNACIDISDGLFYSANELAKRSNLGVVIFYNRIPLSKEFLEAANILNLEKQEILKLLSVAEDYELMMAISPGKLAEIENDINFNLTPIGKFVKEEGVYLKNGRKIEKIEARGYEHFKT